MKNVNTLIEKFHRDGLVTVDFGFPNALINEAAQFTKNYKDWPGSAGENELNRALHHGMRIQDAWKYNSTIKNISIFPKVITFLQKLYRKKPLPFQTLNFPIGTEQDIHSDVIHFNCWPNDGSMCGVWVALEDTDKYNGPLIYYPGSHNLPELYNINLNIPEDKGDYKQAKNFEKKLQKFIQYLKLKPKLATLKKGEAVIWAANLLHGGSTARDKKRSRLSQVTHYFFEGR